MRTSSDSDIWLGAGIRTPFARVDGPLSHLDAIGSVVLLEAGQAGHFDLVSRPQISARG